MARYFKCNKKCTCSRIINNTLNSRNRVCVALSEKPKDVEKCSFYDFDENGLKARRIEREIQNYTYSFYHK